MTNVKFEKTAAILHTLAAKFFQYETIFPGGIITVTAVDVSTDKNNVVVWVGLNNITEEEFTKNIKKIEPALRHFISKESKLRHTPTLKLNIDNSIDAGIKIQKLLD